jgi:hypothetical protein
LKIALYQMVLHRPSEPAAETGHESGFPTNQNLSWTA